MKKRKEKFIKDILHTITYLLVYGIFAVAFSFITVYFSTSGPRIILDWWLKHPTIIVVNAALIYCFMLILHGLSKKIQIPIGLSLVFVTGISVASRTKILEREDPLVLADLALWREALKIAREGQFINTRLIILLGLGLFFIILLFFAPIGRYEISRKKRFGFILLPLFFFFLSLDLVYSVDSPIFSKLPTRNEVELNKALTFQDQGILYSLVTYRNVNRIEKPDPFLNNTVAEYRRDFSPEEEDSRPDVVMMMGEAWSDISRFEKIQFKPGQYPFEILRPIEGNYLNKGYIYTPTYGGGTSNTEYDALTGNSTLMLSSSSFTSYSSVRGDIDSLPRLLSNLGYRTYGMHPGYEWFYNRRNVYDRLGFEKSEFFEDFKDPMMKGRFISEEETTKKFLGNIRDLQEEEDPFFAFCVTIQNHSPFDFNKYQKAFNTFTFQGDLEAEEKTYLETYFTGIRDMNQEIVKICQELNQSERPTVFFYFGDHLPSLTNGFDLYKKLGMNIDEGKWDGVMEIYKTPYIFWANDAYFTQLKEKTSYPNEISAQYISTMILESMGAEKIDPFYGFLYDMRKDMPVVHRFFYLNGSKEEYMSINDLDKRRKERLEIYKTWEYMRAK